MWFTAGPEDFPTGLRCHDCPKGIEAGHPYVQVDSGKLVDDIPVMVIVCPACWAERITCSA